MDKVWRETNDPIDPCALCVQWEHAEVPCDEPEYCMMWADHHVPMMPTYCVLKLYRGIHQGCAQSMAEYSSLSREER